jgi:glucose-6-phosphate isomerase
MNYTKKQWWESFQKHYTKLPRSGLTFDLSRINLDETFSATLEPRIQKAFVDMDALEKGAIANPDKNHMVGLYWLRKAALTPAQEIRQKIESTFAKIKYFGGKVHPSEIKEAGGKCKNFLRIGISGCALCSQFVAQALGNPRKDKLKLFFFDNAAPDVMKRMLSTIDIDTLAAGGTLMDTATHSNIVKRNPAALHVLAWHVSSNDKVINNMAVLSYKDRLELFSKYLQQLIMESLIKDHKLISFLKANLNSQFSLAEISKSISPQVDIEAVFKVHEHLDANKCARIKKKTAASACAARYKMV